MYVDRLLAAGQCARTGRDHGIDVVLDAWSGSPRDRRAAMIAAQGDLPRAASYAGGAWSKLSEGDVSAALEAARAAIASPGMAFLEAEALFAAGAVVAGLERLENLHNQGEPEGTVALVRRRHQLGDHAGAVRAAQTMPWHAHAALTGARSALTANQPGVALRLVEPYLQGFAPLPEPAVAGALVATTAAILATFGEALQLQRFVDRVVVGKRLGRLVSQVVRVSGQVRSRLQAALHGRVLEGGDEEDRGPHHEQADREDRCGAPLAAGRRRFAGPRGRRGLSGCYSSPGTGRSALLHNEAVS